MSGLPSSHTGPGLVDIQVNGYAGLDFNGEPDEWSGAELRRIRDMMARRGVCAALPTLITDRPDAMIARAQRYAELAAEDAELARFFPALHVEGPFVSPATGPRGAHPREHCKQPAELPDFFDRIRRAAAGRIAIFTLAPELPGAIDLIGRLSAAGVCPAIGHTQASKDVLAEAVAAGARLATHLGNGTHQTLPRLDNYVQAQLADDRLSASFIPDGHHMPFGTLKNFIRAKTPARSVIITDAIAAAELPAGEYRLGRRAVVVRPDGHCSKPGEDNLAGSVLTLDRAVINVFGHCGVGFEQAWAMASSHPAALAGMATPPQVTVRISEAGFERC